MIFVKLGQSNTQDLCDVSLQVHSQTVRVRQEQQGVCAPEHFKNGLWEVCDDQGEVAEYVDVVIEVFGNHLFLISMRYLFDVFSHDHSLNLRIFLESGLKQAYQKVKSLLKVLHKSFLIIEHIEKKLLDRFGVAAAIDSGNID